MFAVIKTGGKQYKVAKDQIYTVEKLAAEAGEKVQFNDVLMLGGDKITVGAPLVKDAGVQAEILEQKRGEKTIHFVKRRRKHSSQRKKGHRQQLTVVKITDILAKGAEKSGVKAALGGAGVSVAAVSAATVKPKAAKADAKPKAAKADAKPAAATKAKAKPAAKVAAADAKDTGSAPANLLKSAKGDADDLKKISGVGPALEKKLNDLGVFHYWQITEWNADDVAYVDDRLSFKGRIERDDWIKQAKEFAADAK